ncbi:MAG TPA: VOC family protein [Steroidobacteraceae bacterium]|nr:VOC family protein [Steroidobacteraceae bacterium]
MLGRFHEVSLATADIRASVEFYERLGFIQAQTSDTYSHPYGVLTDGRIFLGLHERRFASPALTFVHAGIIAFADELEARGIELDSRRVGNEVFNEIGFRDPSGQAVRVIEARTFSPVVRRPEETSLCGYFTEYSLPTTSFEEEKAFWEPLGFVATEEPDAPYAHLPLTSDHLDLAFHQPRTLDQPMLVFRDSGMRERLARIRMLGVKESGELPRGLPEAANALIQAPEGTMLLLLEGES